MNTVLDVVVVSCILFAAGCYAFLSLAPRSWRTRVLTFLGALAANIPGLSGGVGARLQAAAARSAAAGSCGGCGDCGSDKPAGPTADVNIPLSSLKRRR
jgi:hypothetical protein